MRRPDASELTSADRDRLAAAGIPVAELMRQWALLLNPPPPPRIVRPCTVGDGIRRVPPGEREALAERGALFLAGACPTKFVPASGAATRMFQDLLAWRAEKGTFALEQLASVERIDPVAASVLRTLRHLRSFAFFPELYRALAVGGTVPEQALSGSDATLVVETLLGPGGLNLAGVPKALLPFHAGPDGPRSAFLEHLHEALEVASGADGRTRLHFTVSSDHKERFEEARNAALAAFASEGSRFEVTFSVQDASTDTIAIRPDGTLARGRDGTLILRPAGHGALLGNLAACPGDVLLVRNIDNVEPAARRGERVFWTRVLAGVLHETLSTLADLGAAIEDGSRAVSDAMGDVKRLLGVDLLPLVAGRDATAARSILLERLARPVRVCGMVPNVGEPGGGPFWVMGTDGLVTPQIIESAQVAVTMDQQAIFAAATHFNPVDMILAPDGARGRRVALEAFADSEAVIVTRKNVGGEPALVLERPGLWNGSMAGWNTVFVELPIDVFHPVKTVNDLLRPAHRPVDEASADPG